MNSEPGCDAGMSPQPEPSPPPIVQRHRSANYFIRHWRGELPLLVSYWVNGVLANLLAVGAWVIPVMFTNVGSNYGWVLGWSGFWIILMLLNLWQVVGIWRSARRHIQATNRSGWARTAQVLMVIWSLRLTSEFATQGIPSIRESLDQARWLNENAKWEMRVLKDGTEVELSGGIGYGMSADLERTLDATPRARLIHVNLGSGGLVEEAKKARSLIRSRGLDTYTSSACVSACTVVFMGGKERYVKRGARLGFHAFKKPGVYGEANENVLTEEKSYLTSIGVSASFATTVTETPQPQMWYPTDEELVESGVVTAFTDGDRFAMSGFGELPEVGGLDAGFQGLRLYRVLKGRHPELYKQILDASHQGLKNGESAESLRIVTLPLLLTFV